MPKNGPVNLRKSWRIGIVGSRRRNKPSDFLKLYAVFKQLYRPGDMIVSGGCATGADRWAEEIAAELQIVPVIYCPDFKNIRIPACYFARNTEIAEDCDVLIALCAPDRTGGTEDTVRKTLKLGKRVIYA